MSSINRRKAPAVLVAVVALLAMMFSTSQAQAAGPEFTGEVSLTTATWRGGDQGSALQVVLRNTGDTLLPAGTPITYKVDAPNGIAIRGAVGSGTCDLAASSCTVAVPGNLNPNSTFPFGMRFTVDRSVVGLQTLSFEASAPGVPTVNLDEEIQIEPYRPFGAHDVKAGAFDDLGQPFTVAGGHPDSASLEFRLNLNTRYTTSVAPVEDMRRVITELPAGFTGNPEVVKTCTEAVMVKELCPPESQVGVIEIDIENAVTPTGIFRIAPQPGVTAQFGFAVVGVGVAYMYASVRTDGDNGITITVPSTPQAPATLGAKATLWGTPSDPKWDAQRCARILPFWCIAKPSEMPMKPFLTMQARECPDTDPVTRLLLDSWQNMNVFRSFEATSPKVTGCEDMTFDPEVTIAPTNRAAGKPTGLVVDLTFPTEDSADGIAPPALKKAVVTLPEGMTINPAAADGLKACTDEQLKLTVKQPVECPEAAKVATVTATSPLLKETFTGSAYIRSQNSNDPESGEMFRLALVLESEERGVSVRLPGQIRVNKQTGRIETTFDNNPELPVSNVHLTFKDGPRAPLSTPSTCGTKTIDTVLSSWGKQTTTHQSKFTVPCEGASGFAPSFAAGTTDPQAGTFSSFMLSVARRDADEELKSIRSIQLPEGLLGNVGSVPLCGEAQAAAGSCPESARVGHVQAAAGAGSSPLWIPQASKEPTGVYLTGPYKGAPYGLSIKVPAQAGPFDLGRVVVRSALHVDERTAAITSGVDETRLIDPDGTVTEVLPEALPRILKGIVLNQREIRVIVDRKDFIVNPTNCSQGQIAAEIQGYGGNRADVGNRFRAADCALLGFAPRFNARILDRGRRSTVRSWHPRTRFTVVPRKGDANIGGARVALPSSTILDQSNIGTTCTRAQMTARDCPEKSVVGYAKAWSPLLRKAVEGPVYLAANGGVRPLPDLAAVLDGEIRVVLQGEISTLRSGGKARLQNTFRVVPDAPVNRFVLTMRGGKNRGLLVNSTDLCRTSERGVAVFQGQNGRTNRLRPRLATTFKGCAKVRRQAGKRVARKMAAAKSATKRFTKG